MTELEWLNCSDTESLLSFLDGKASERKLRLFACACCRNIWHRMTLEVSRRAIDTAEQYADEEAGIMELSAAHNGAWLVWGTPAATAAADASEVSCRAGTAWNTANHAAWASTQPTRADELRLQATILRDIVFSPFRPLPSVNSSWLIWNNCTVTSLAQTIYAHQAFDRLPILGDALEEAGWSNNEILAHLRSPGPHVRGCWALDLILGKS